MDRTREKYLRQLETAREWKKSNPERHAELARAYRARNREKTLAQNKLNYAVRTGRMSRLPCEVCGTDEKVHAHHSDYSKPYDVRWLCFKCHKTSHPVDDDDKAIKFGGARKARLRGERNPNAALKDSDIDTIRAMLSLGISQERIGALYGVSQVTISRIKLRKVYGNT
jgi:ribosomal protein S27AE